MPGRRHPRSRRPRPATALLIPLSGLMAGLLAFCVLLISVSRIEQPKLQLVTRSLQNALGAVGRAAVPTDEVTDKVQELFEFQQAVSQVRMKEALRRSLSRMLEEDSAELSETAEGFLVRIDADLLFEPDSVTVRRGIEPQLRKLARLLVNNPNQTYIIGHTDALSASTYKPAQNVWSLSAAYAASVVDFLVSKGKVEASHLQVRGMGDTMPRSASPSTKKTAQQRRVEILITHSLAPKASSLDQATHPPLLQSTETLNGSLRVSGRVQP